MKDKKLYARLIVTQGTADFFNGKECFTENLDLLKGKIREWLNLKNVHFLLGSGASNGAIPTMSALYESLTFDKDEKDLEDEFERIAKKSENNLETCLTVMYAARTYFEGLKESDDDAQKEIDANIQLYKRLIDKVEKHIFKSINIDFGNLKAEQAKVLDYYKTFYQKLALRNKDNARIRVLTTNNDLFSETVLDALNIHYINGFGGGLHRFFNPALFNYTMSKRMDTSIDKYEPVENMVYLYKIHGSVNWREAKNKTNTYFEIEEVMPSETRHEGTTLIYPTPTKQDKSLGSLYVDLFREFQNKLLEPHSVLFVIGYSFSDRHVNDIIYRALATNSTINVVIFSSKPKEEDSAKKPIFFINDSRIFTISGAIYKDREKKVKDRTINHFDYIVNELLPNLDESRKEDELINKFVNSLKSLRENEDR